MPSGAESSGLPRGRAQAGKLAIAPTVGFLVLLLKSTSLASIIGFVEVTRAGQIINNVTFQPFLVFGIVAAIWLAVKSSGSATIEKGFEICDCGAGLATGGAD